MIFGRYVFSSSTFAPDPVPVPIKVTNGSRRGLTLPPGEHAAPAKQQREDEGRDEDKVAIPGEFSGGHTDYGAHRGHDPLCSFLRQRLPSRLPLQDQTG